MEDGDYRAEGRVKFSDERTIFDTRGCEINAYLWVNFLMLPIPSLLSASLHVSRQAHGRSDP